MFTGIIEEIGQITRIDPAPGGIKLSVGAQKVLEDIKIGDSIAINGACQTVISFDSASFTVDVSSETLNVTTFKHFTSGEKVNLERALKLSDRLGGHLVSGHVDAVGELLNIKKEGNMSMLSFSVPENISRYLIYKGSITIDGISLTVANLENNDTVFSVAVIPHTLSNTVLLGLKIGNKVNLESDILAKYIEKLLKNNTLQKEKSSNITYDFLVEHGFG